MRIVQLGVRGFGEVHLERIARLQQQGTVELVGVVAPSGAPEGIEVPWFETLGEALVLQPDIVSIATPMHTHLTLASEALRAGAHVLLEKPPVTSLAEFSQLLQTIQDSGRAVQVGFQSLASAGIVRLGELLAQQAFGSDPQVSARGVWVRDRAYYRRSEWAGRRIHQGRRVADGVVTNQLPHALVSALAAVDALALGSVTGVDLELYHAHHIEADDTAFVRVLLANGGQVCAALTVCGEADEQASVEIVGCRGRASYRYEDDKLDLELDGVSTTEHFERTDLLENLVAHARDGAPLLVPLANTGSFMAVLEATQSAADPVAITRGVSWQGEGDQAHPVLADVSQWVDRALAEHRGFHALGAPWAADGLTAQWRA